MATAYEGPKGPWSVAEKLLKEYNLDSRPGIKFEYGRFDYPDPFYLLASRHLGLRVLVGLGHSHIVSGTLAPDAAGNYQLWSWYDKNSYLRRPDLAYFIWRDAENARWIISEVLGTPGPAFWERPDDKVAGDYTPAGTATGTATVTQLEPPIPNG